MVYGTYNELVTGANLNQRSHHWGGLTLYGTSAMKVDHVLWKAVLDFQKAGQPRSPEAQPGDLGQDFFLMQKMVE